MSEREDISRAQAGDKRAQSELFRRLEPALRNFIRRFVGQPDDTDDLTQDALVDLFALLPSLKGDEEPLAERVRTLAAVHLLAFMAEQRRWRPAAQIIAQSVCEEEGLTPLLLEVLRADTATDNARSGPASDTAFDAAFDAGEHIAFCFTCIGRALPFEQQLAVTLVDVLGLDLNQAAALAGIDDKHAQAYLTAGREALQVTFDKLCVFSSPTGACDQCRGLRDAAPDARKGPALDGPHGLVSDFAVADPQERLRARLRVVRASDLDRGKSHVLHDELFRLIARVEANRNALAKKDDDIPPGRARWEILQSSNN